MEKKAATAKFSDRFPGRGFEGLAFEREADLKLFRNVARYMSSIRADIRDIENSDLSAGGKKAESDELYREMIRTAQDALETTGK